MKKIKFYLSLFFVSVSLSSFSQTGACCLYLSSGNGFFCVQRTESECTAIGGSFKGVGSICTLDNTCPTTVCCSAGGKCTKFMTQEECLRSGANNRWFASALCSVCAAGGRIVNVEGVKAIYSPDNKTVELSWQTDATMNGEFYIMRGRQATELKTIGYLDPAAANNGKYVFTDINPYEVGYYQLMFISNNELAYSQVLTVVGTGSDRMQVMPNPATGQVRVLLNNMQLYNTEISLLDLSGRQVRTWSLSKGQHEINIAGLPQGTYILRGIQNGQTYTSRLVKK